MKKVTNKTLNNKIVQIRKELKQNIDKEYKKGNARFYKPGENIKGYGVRTKIVRKISSAHFKETLEWNKEDILSFSEKLLASGYNEESIMGFDFARRIKKDYKKSDFSVFKRWLSKYVDNWSKCDSICMFIFNYFLEMYPEYREKMILLTKSKNKWERRAAAVSFISNSKRGFILQGSLKDVFKVANILLEDEEDIVQKGYGWMLKEASEAHQKDVFDFVVKNKKRMPRTALRYAIEKMPQRLRKKAMVK